MRFFWVLSILVFLVPSQAAITKGSLTSGKYSVPSLKIKSVGGTTNQQAIFGGEPVAVSLTGSSGKVRTGITQSKLFRKEIAVRLKG